MGESLKKDDDKVVIVVVNYFSSRLLEKNLPKLVLLGKVVVVDNSCCAIERRALESLEANNLGVYVVYSKSNVGFGGGCNLGVEFALDLGFQFHSIGLVNPDVCIAEPESMKEALARFERSEAAYFQPRVIDSRGARSVQGLRHAAPVPLLLSYTFLRGCISALAVLRVYPSEDADTQSIFVPSGACVFVKTQVLQQSGGIPQNNFLYFEELLFAHRARVKSGYLDEHVSVLHEVGATTGHKAGKGSPKMLRYRLTSHLSCVDEMLEGRLFSKVFVKALIGLDYFFRRIYMAV
ncbi:glycosyltransferase family 2 protein [Agaribacterium haliotis]|uniref:glycosyltransferase family 2 protein n=1 Tax=Agaribacterium haliotis TaxID=2013869 RepID=UPI000BB56501|nr:glycosyltransferase family 2 protein [Agaribacterium haliotis]